MRLGRLRIEVAVADGGQRLLAEEEQLQDLKDITQGNFSGVWDSVASSEQFARKALKDVSMAKAKFFATTDDWTPMDEHEDHETCRVKLGLIGRTGDDIREAPTINEEIASFIPLLVQLLEAGKLRPNELKVTGTGFEAISEAINIQQKGASGGVKVVVSLQPE